jgi:hypothetical protein
MGHICNAARPRFGMEEAGIYGLLSDTGHD